jgi:hypothetical protein
MYCFRNMMSASGEINVSVHFPVGYIGRSLLRPCGFTFVYYVNNCFVCFFTIMVFSFTSHVSQKANLEGVIPNVGAVCG